MGSARPLLARAPVNSIKPGNAKRSRLDRHYHRIAILKTVEVVGIHRQARNFLPVAPAFHEKAPAAAHQPFHVETVFHRRWAIDEIFWRIEFAIQEKRRSQQPRQRNKSVIDALQDFEFLSVARAAIQNKRQRQRQKKQQAEKNQHQIEVQWWIDLADVREG